MTATPKSGWTVEIYLGGDWDWVPTRLVVLGDPGMDEYLSPVEYRYRDDGHTQCLKEKTTQFCSMQDALRATARGVFWQSGSMIIRRLPTSPPRLIRPPLRVVSPDGAAYPVAMLLGTE
jgi:hypothetical protein